MSGDAESEVYIPFSERERQRALEGKLDPLMYDGLPSPLRIQIGQILQRAIGKTNVTVAYPHYPERVWSQIYEDTIHELGVPEVGSRGDEESRVIQNINSFGWPISKSLDAIEIAFRALEEIKTPASLYKPFSIRYCNAVAIAELNRRFKQHGVGYQFVNGFIVRVDSEHLYAEVILPAIRLLNLGGVESAEAELISALEHYRHDRYSEARVDAVKALESTMKIALGRKCVSLTGNENAGVLIRLTTEHLVPKYLENQFEALKNLLQGAPTVRNKDGAHGAGESEANESAGLTMYVIDSAAAAIKFIVESFNELEARAT